MCYNTLGTRIKSISVCVEVARSSLTIVNVLLCVSRAFCMGFYDRMKLIINEI